MSRSWSPHPFRRRRSYAGETYTLNQARGDAESWLRDAGVDADDLSRAVLVVSELTTNAVQAAPGESYELDVGSHDDESLQIRVTSRTEASDIPERNDWKPSEVMSVRGRGLSIVDALSEAVNVTRPRPGWVTVTARLAHST